MPNIAVNTRSRKLFAKLLKGPTQLGFARALGRFGQVESWWKGISMYPQQWNLCCSNCCIRGFSFCHITARLERVFNVENHISSPITKVTKMQTRSIHEWTFSQVRLALRISPGMEVKKARNIRPASTKAPLSGVWESSKLGATFSVVGAFIAFFERKTTVTRRAPVATNRASASKNERRYFANILPDRGQALAVRRCWREWFGLDTENLGEKEK